MAIGLAGGAAQLAPSMAKALTNGSLMNGRHLAKDACSIGLNAAMASDNFRSRIMPVTAAAALPSSPKHPARRPARAFSRTERWLAVADLHFGYELSQRAAGRLVPLWGMTSIEERLVELFAEYEPRHLIVVGDLVHDRPLRRSARAAARLRRAAR